MAKKLYGLEAELFKGLIKESTKSIVDVEGNRYLIQQIEANEVEKEIESDPELREMIKRADEDIKRGRLYTTEEILDAIDRGEV
ncbi:MULTISPECIES: hypothetical protein [Bacillaceae]|uniref:Uncharacterized protein n=1 Tax=Evansella alkalicola TaxID=745819 RepID=A0ABS6JZL8_9BACI|nr:MULTISPECIES: hypothetical protein [Bacillaceae]MBU9723835.1 hypothetical protein [Bacillus alkalicola]